MRKYYKKGLSPKGFYPPGSYITSYGRFGLWDTKLGVKEACGQEEPQVDSDGLPQGATINPPCSESMIELGIDVENN
jgi:hypothetical protein